MNKQKCCPRKCFKLFDVPSVVSSRKFFWLRPFPERVEWFYDKAMDCQDVSSHPLWSSENGNRICSKAFRDIYGIQKNFFYKYLTKFKNGAVAAGKDRCQFPSSTYNRAMTWLQEFATDYGDRMPHTQDILLPYKTRKLSVWEKYSNETAEAMESQLGCSTFQTMWKKHFPHLKIKKVSVQTCKCTYYKMVNGGSQGDFNFFSSGLKVICDTLITHKKSHIPDVLVPKVVDISILD